MERKEIDLTERETWALHWAVIDAVDDLPAALEACLETFDEPEELERRFGPETAGHHEAVHTAYMLFENWHQYILEHPATVMNPHVYRAAMIAHSFMMETYQQLAMIPWDAEDRALAEAQMKEAQCPT